jgi:SpoIVB peptidase S55
MTLRVSVVKTVFAVFAATALCAGTLWAPAGAQSATPPDCPDVKPVGELTRGMMTTGWTVSRGTEPEQFSAEILGVLQDGIAPGRDLIIVEAHSEAIDRAGGVWAGMSGSPIYHDGKIVGAVSYGLSYGPSNIAGVTPAEDMKDLLDYAPSDEDSRVASKSQARTVHMSKKEQRSVARSAGTSEDEVGSEFSQLKLPVGISGLGTRGMTKVARMLDRENAPFIPYAASSGTAEQTTSGGEVHAGDNFAAALSYGDITFSAVGTTTMVCDGKILAFGHYFDFSGDTSLGSNQADAITIVDDPLFGPFKLANISRGVGTLDQDRMAGVRTLVGPLPDVVPITSTVHALNNGRSRTGTTYSLDDDYLAFLAYYHVYSNVLVTMDEYSQGSAEISWTIEGTTDDGTPWSFERSNLYTSRYSIADEAPYELLSDIYALQGNDFEEIHFTSVDFEATVREEMREFKLRGVKTAVNDDELGRSKRLKVSPGDVITIQETLHPLTDDGEKNPDTSQDQVVTQTLTVPEEMKRDGTLGVTGGSSDYQSRICLYRPRRCDSDDEGAIDSFAKFIEALEGRAHNNDVISRLYTGRRTTKVMDEEITTTDRVVRGHRTIDINLRGTGGGRRHGTRGGKGHGLRGGPSTRD